MQFEFLNMFIPFFFFTLKLFIFFFKVRFKEYVRRALVRRTFFELVHLLRVILLRNRVLLSK
jgi:hypothetical protein